MTFMMASNSVQRKSVTGRAIQLIFGGQQNQ